MCAQMNESAILGTKLSVQVARCVTWRIARCYDPDALFKVCPCLPALIARLPSAHFGVGLPLVQVQVTKVHLCSLGSLWTGTGSSVLLLPGI